MKRGILVLLFFSLSYLGMAQILLGGKIGYGYFGIMNDNKMGDRADYSNCLDKIIFSIEAKQNTNHLINLGISFDYVNQSFNVSSYWGGPGATYKANADFSIGSLYFEFKPQFTFGKRIRYFFYPGFILGTLLHSNVNGTLFTNSMNSIGVTSKLDQNGSSYFPYAAFGFVAGIGIDIPLTSRLTLNVENKNNLRFWGPEWGSNKSSLYNLNVLCGIFYKL
ncbi:MAG: hypothetical protein Q8867_06170 [Bacteroidota bacterium]|nr:hypothetical protein [Bacteroidota bacterium]